MTRPHLRLVTAPPPSVAQPSGEFDGIARYEGPSEITGGDPLATDLPDNCAALVLVAPPTPDSGAHRGVPRR